MAIGLAEEEGGAGRQKKERRRPGVPNMSGYKNWPWQIVEIQPLLSR